MAEPKRTKAKSTSPPPAQISVVQFIIATLVLQFFLSYVITETWTWGYKSKWTNPANWKFLIVTRSPASRAHGIATRSEPHGG
jgi:hypothetical protein